MTEHGTTELRVQRTLTATPDRVWTAFTTPQALIAWFWPGAWTTTAEIDLTPGGRYRIASVDKGMAVSGEYVAVDPKTRIVQTWRWDGDDEETLVTVTIEASGDGTALTILHERFATDEDRDNHLQGWNDCLDRLSVIEISTSLDHRL